MNFFRNLFRKKSTIRKTDLTRRFDLISRIGQGSMSKVWRARDTMSGRIVALKVLDRVKTLRFESRFVGLNKPSEGTVAIQLKHPHIVRTNESGVTLDDEQFLVMEFISGVSLSYLVDVQNDIMQQRRLTFIVQLGEAIDYFHRQNWIHRDLCPRNVLLDENYDVKLIDFGLAVPNTAEFRKPGNRTGTANYMAPELIKRQTTDQRIDLFSYAVSCFEMYTQRLPWEGAETLEMVVQHINKPAVDIREIVPDIDEQVAATIMKGLEGNPRNRWSSAREMVTEFREARKRLGQEPEGDEERYAAFHTEQRYTATVTAETASASRRSKPETADTDVDANTGVEHVPSQKQPEDEHYYRAEVHGFDDDDDDDDEYEEV